MTASLAQFPRKVGVSDAPKPPSHLAPATKAWWSSVLAKYVLDEHHIRLLTAAAEAWDRYQDARKVIAQQGATYTDRFGAPRLRPECAIERDSRLAFAKMLGQLDLDAADIPGGRKPG